MNIQPEHIHARATFGRGDIRTLQNFMVELMLRKLDNPIVPKQVSFKNKQTLDCRLSNLIFLNERKGVMRTRKGKRNSSSQYKGVRQTPLNKVLGNWSVEIYDPNIGRI